MLEEKRFEVYKRRIPWNKEKKLSPETIKKIRKTNTIFCKGHIPWNKGKKQTAAHLHKNSESHIGQIPWNKGKKQTAAHLHKNSESHMGLVSGMKGKSHTKEVRKKMSETRKEWFRKNPEYKKKIPSRLVRYWQRRASRISFLFIEK